MSETSLPPVAPEPALPTQSAHPGRATARTVVQNVLGFVIALGTVLPIAVAIVQEELADFLPEQVVTVLIVVGAVAAALAAATARIMAIPRVDRWLAGNGVLAGLASRPAEPGPARSTPAAAVLDDRDRLVLAHLHDFLDETDPGRDALAKVLRRERPRHQA